MSEIPRHCQQTDLISVFQQMEEEDRTSLFNRITDPKADSRSPKTELQAARNQQPEPSTEDVTRAAEYHARIEAKVSPSFEDVNKILRDQKIDWNTKLQESGYKPVNDKSVSLGDILVVTGREMPIIVESEEQRDFTESNYDNLTTESIKHWRKGQ